VTLFSYYYNKAGLLVGARAGLLFLFQYDFIIELLDYVSVDER
jgi:hypothetical protein